MSLIAETTLSMGDYAAIGGLFAAIAAITTTLVLGNLKGLGRRIDVIENRVGEIERCKADAEETKTDLRDLGKRKAEKVEFVRESILARNKMGEIGSKLGELSGKLDTNFGIGVAVDRLADEFAKYREAQSHDR